MTQPERTLDRYRIRAALTTALGSLTDGQRLTLVDLGAERLVTWEMSRDPVGTPTGTARPGIPWSDVFEGADRPEDVLARAVPSGAVMLACTRPDGVYATKALDDLRRAHPDAPVFLLDDVARFPIRDLLKDVVADQPLTQWYDLVVLERSPSGRLSIGHRQLFVVNARRGDRTILTVDCEPSGAGGTAFAVVAHGEHDQGFRLVGVQSAKVPPGRYEVTAELRRPGLVRFDGLTVRPRRDERDWGRLVADVPQRLPDAGSGVHLVCAIETSGPADQVAERIARAEDVVVHAGAELHDRVRVSVLTYGPHRLERAAPDVPETVLVWDAPANAAGAALGRLADRPPEPVGYPVAARLECALTLVADRLHSTHGRAALLTIGDRPPNPLRAATGSALPCPRRRDAMTAW
ncbi:MAG: hypothetical protein ACRDNL_18555, partial [Spirillospora sp.]